MRKIVLSTVTVALIAASASASQAFAAQSHHARKATPTTASEQLRNAVAQPSQPAWQYSGWSAPAGR
ncbi:UNVERIFIED_ORG: hypothetical protein M2193_000649 [Bradyrhizobium japonicum]|uniref:hypothetical protein n=1 Tax=Bradyrhizobium TaxID=374 RepID=UPI00348E527D